MDILTEDMKKELREKFKALDINDEKFQEKAQKIIDDAILESKDKIGETVVQKTVDEALEEEKECYGDLKQLVDEGILENFTEQTVIDDLKEKAERGIKDEAAEKVSLEMEGFLKEPNKETTIEDIVAEILNQLEAVIEEKKQEVQNKIDEKDKMIENVQKREKLRAAKVKVGNLHNKTKNLKGTEGKELNVSVEAAITDLDRQIDALVVATTVDGHELQSDALKQEREQLVEEKKKLEDMCKFLKEKYTKDHSKEASKLLIQDEIKQKMSEIQYGMSPNNLIKKCEEIKAIYNEYKDKGNFTETDLKNIFENEKSEELKINAYNLGAIGEINEIRRLYMKETNKPTPTEEDKKTIEKYKEYFERRNGWIEDICGGKKALPLQTENEYIEELENLQKDAEAQGFLKIGVAKKAAKKAKALRLVLREVISETRKNSQIPNAYAMLRQKLGKNKSIREKDLPKELLDGVEQNAKSPVVKKAITSKIIKIAAELDNQEKVPAEVDKSKKDTEGVQAEDPSNTDTGESR